MFDLTATNTVTGTTASAGYQFFEVVPQNTTFTALTNGQVLFNNYENLVRTNPLGAAFLDVFILLPLGEFFLSLPQNEQLIIAYFILAFLNSPAWISARADGQ